jgi:hypothetical protein
MRPPTSELRIKERNDQARAQAITAMPWKRQANSNYLMKKYQMKKAMLVCLFLVISPILHAQTWSTLPVDLVIPMNTSTAGTALTTTIADAGTVSSVCTVGTSCYFSSLPAGAFEVGSYQGCSNLGPVQMNGSGGALYPAQSLAYNNYAHLDSANGDIGMFTFSNGVISTQNFTISMCLTLGFPATANGNDWDMIMVQTASGFYADMQFNGQACGGNSFGVRIETHDVNPHSPCIPLTAQQTYYFSMNWDTSNGVECLFAWSPQGTFIGNSCISDSSTTGQGTVKDVRLFSNENGTNAGTYSKYQNIMMKWSSASPTGTATFNKGSSTVTGSGFATDGSWNNGIIAVGSATSYEYYTIASVQSSTQLTLAATFSGNTGTANYAVELPLFWASSSSTVQPPQPPTAVKATAQ